VAPEAFALVPPPGVINSVLAGGGATAALLLLELELLLELCGDPHGSTATVWVSVLLGITISLEPGGILVLPDSATTAASEHGGTATVSALCCFGMTIVLTPGLWSAAETGSVLDELPELPQADSTAAAAARMTAAGTTRDAANLALLIFLLPLAALHRCYPRAAVA
jgi:hypothetical protein